MQLALFSDDLTEFPGAPRHVSPFKTQLLKWIGSKQRFAHEIVSYFPTRFGTYIEPFLGSGAVLGTLSPAQAIASDVLEPLVTIWQTMAQSPDQLKRWYDERWQRFNRTREVYYEIRASYNAHPNAADLLFISRACYGGVVRFRRDNGHISTPCGIHNPVNPNSFAKRVDLWHQRTQGAYFVHSDFEPIMDAAEPGDLIYCDPPYTHTQAILYGAQPFSLQRLFEAIERCKKRKVYIALSIDGTKRSGTMICDLPIPERLFEREVIVNCGRSMLRRFQMDDQTLEGEVVADRLLLTY